MWKFPAQGRSATKKAEPLQRRTALVIWVLGALAGWAVIILLLLARARGYG
jgi:hypothetical protein